MYLTRSATNRSAPVNRAPWPAAAASAIRKPKNTVSSSLPFKPLFGTSKPAPLVKIPSNLKNSKGEKITVLSEKTLSSGQKITVVQGDITDVVVDAIVHPTNNSFYMGGEVGAAIARRGGAQLRNNVSQLQTSNGNLAVCGGKLFKIFLCIAAFV